MNKQVRKNYLNKYSRYKIYLNINIKIKIEFDKNIEDYIILGYS